jgi:hypothetical protein
MDINRSGPRRLACLLATLVGPAVAAAATPGTFLKLDDDTLQVTAGRDVTMTLETPEREAWSQANVCRFQVRTFGRVETIEPDPNRTSTEMTYRFNEPGYAMVILAAGPGSTKGQTDSIQRAPYCAKLLVRVDPDPADAQARAAPMKSPGLMAKTGMKVEVSPYIDPTSLPLEAIENGADLPVRVYFEGISQKQVPVTAYGPDGTQQTETTDSHGITRFKVKTPGRWLVRYQHDVDGVTYTGDLVFDLGTTQQGEGK